MTQNERNLYPRAGYKKICTPDTVVQIPVLDQILSEFYEIFFLKHFSMFLDALNFFRFFLVEKTFFFIFFRKPYFFYNFLLLLA
jgi:hypothetical protein